MARFGISTKAFLSVAAIFTLLALLFGCGGSTSGSGGVTVDGRILSTASSRQPIAGVVVMIS